MHRYKGVTLEVHRRMRVPAKVLSLLGKLKSLFPAPEQQCPVGAAEAEGVRHGVLNLGFS